MKHAILVDFGSTFTKIVLVDLKEKKILLTDQAPSTVHTDAGIALEQCFDSVRKVLSEEEFDQALKLSSSSAAGGLRMAVIGLTKNLSIAAGQAAVFGAGAKIMGIYYGMLNEESAKEIADMNLEIVLLCGGYEKGNQTMVLHNAQVLAESGIHVPIVYSGNREAARGVQWLMKSHEKECFLVENILPAVGVLNVGPAQELIRHPFYGKNCEYERAGKGKRETGWSPDADPGSGSCSRGTVEQRNNGNSWSGRTHDHRYRRSYYRCVFLQY